MTNKFFHFFISSVLLLVFVVTQPTFAGFNITVVNKSGMEYNNIEIVIKAVGFGAMCGCITLTDIKSGPKPQKFIIEKNDCFRIPLTVSKLPPPEECNLDLYVVTSPKQASAPIQDKHLKNIIIAGTTPQIITEDKPYRFPPHPMKGIQPPNFTIIINPDGSINDRCT